MRLGIIIDDCINDSAFDEVKDLGLDFIEACTNFDNQTDDFISKVDVFKKNIKRTGIDIGSVGRWNLRTNSGGKIVESEYQKHVKLMHAAKEVGSPVYVCGINRDHDVSLFKNYCAAVELFGRLVEEGKKLGITVAVYNCDWENFVCTDRHWDVVMGEIPELMIKYDASHTMERGQDYMADFNKWLPRIAHIHLKGVTKIGDRVVDNPPAGIDQIDWRGVFSLLYLYNYNGGLSIEPHSSVWNGALGDAGIKYTIQYMKQFLLDY